VYGSDATIPDVARVLNNVRAIYRRLREYKKGRL